MKALKILLGILLCLFIVFILGPRVESPKLALDTSKLIKIPRNLDITIARQESKFPNIKPGNAAEIVWANPSKNTTAFSVVYLHGFSASHEEGNALHREFAKRYGANLYLARLQDHGLKDSDESLSQLTADGLLQSAYDAIKIGKILGNKVIVLTCSTGSTLGLYLASLNEDIHALFNYSPNIDLANTDTRIFNKPWGMSIAKLINGSDYHSWEATEEAKKYWNSRYKMDALGHLRQLVDYTMTEEVFSKIKQPVFNAYYDQDETVSVEAIKQMHKQLGSSHKELQGFPKSGSHMMISKLHSKDLPAIKAATFKFAEEKVGMKKVHNTQPLPELTEN